MIKKHLNTILIVFICSAVTLAFASTNNFGWSFLNWNSQGKEISAKEVDERVQEHLIKPLKDALTERDPHMFMTKCFSDVLYTVHGKKITDIEYTFYDNSTLEGLVFLHNCNQTESMCTFRMNLATNEITVKESFLSGWVPLNEFTSKFNKEEESTDNEE